MTTFSTYALPVSAMVEPIYDETEFSTVNAKLSEVIRDTAQSLFSNEEGFDAKLTVAAAPPIANGRPRMLHLTAIIVHEGVNLNGHGFYKEDLINVVANKKLFREGYSGMIDVNHDFSPVGYWYDAEIVEDPKSGTTGIMAKGAIWAWAFPELADKILADQHRNGDIKVSMACLTRQEDVVLVEQEDGRPAAFNRNPVFIATTILLDTKGGDAHARGVADEDPIQITDQERKKVLLRAATLLNGTQNEPEEEEMLDEIKSLLGESLGENSKEIVAQVADLLEKSQTASETALSEAKATIDSLNEQNATLQTTLEEQKLALEGLKETNEDLSTKVAQLEEKLNNYEAEEAERAKKALIEARLAELSDSVRDRLNKKEEAVREAILARWAEQSDEEWEVTKAEHALATTPETIRESDGRFPATGSSTKANSLESFLK